MTTRQPQSVISEMPEVFLTESRAQRAPLAARECDLLRQLLESLNKFAEDRELLVVRLAVRRRRHRGIVVVHAIDEMRLRVVRDARTVSERPHEKKLVFRHPEPLAEPPAIKYGPP